MFKSDHVFPVAIFHGKSKPSSAHQFLADFVNEVDQLKTNGIQLGGKILQFNLKAIVCDAPARAFIKCTIGHTGYYACERCEIKGFSRNNRIVYDCCTQEDIRTSEKFNTLQYKKHQKELSPLHSSIDCIHGFPLDYMHMVLLGVVKRMLVFLIKGDKVCKISNQQSIENSARLVGLRGQSPSNFDRQPRGLKDLCYWKATELRQFLLYLGPVVLKGIVSEKIYDHFLVLHVALSLLLKDEITEDVAVLDYAKNLLKYFSSASSSVYGSNFHVYNVHSLTHIADDVSYHKCSPNDLSAFKFENYMQGLKKMIRNGSNPVVQITKRLSEIPDHKSKINVTSPFKLNGKDCFFLSLDDEVCEIKKIKNDDFECEVIRKSSLESLYTSPCDSATLNIFYLKNSERIHTTQRLVAKDCAKQKMTRFTYKNGFVFFPLLHKVECNMF